MLLFYLNKRDDSYAMLVGEEFRDISFAMQNRISSLGNLPPATRWSSLDPPSPLTSWRLEISEFLEGFSYPGADYSSSWDSASNSQLHNMPTSLALSFRLDVNPQNHAKVLRCYGAEYGVWNILQGFNFLVTWGTTAGYNYRSRGSKIEKALDAARRLSDRHNP